MLKLIKSFMVVALLATLAVANEKAGYHSA